MNKVNLEQQIGAAPKFSSSEDIENKKMVIVYGNCHTSIISQMLEANPAFNEKYYIYPTERIQNIKDPKDLYQDCYAHCDVFIHQSIRLNNRYGEEYASERIIARLKPSCKVIAIPNVYHLPLCFFPQYHDAPELKNKDVMHCTTFFFRDSIVDAHLGSVRGLLGLYKRVKADYQNPLLFDNNGIIDSFNQFIDKVRKREEAWDIKVSQFIIEKYQQHQLFYDPNHPTNYFLSYIARELLNLLVEGENFGVVELEIKETLESIEFPICQSAVTALGLQWKETVIRRNNPITRVTPCKMNLFWYTYQYFIFIWMAKDFPISLRIISKLLWYNNHLVFFIYRVIRKAHRIVNHLNILIKLNKDL